MKCPNCEHENDESYEFCINCGAALRPDESTQDQKKVKAAPESKPAPVETDKDEEPRKRSGLRVVLLVSAVLACSIVAIAGIFFRETVADFINLPELPGLGQPKLDLGKGNYVLLGLPSRSGNIDLTMVRVGKELKDGTQILENVFTPYEMAAFYHMEIEEPMLIGAQGLGMGGFIPGTDYSILHYLEDEDIFIAKYRVNEDEPAALFDTAEGDVHGYAFDEGKNLFINERRGNIWRCYTSTSNEEAKRIGKGEICGISEDGSTIYIVEYSSDGTTLTLMDFDGDNETLILDDEKGRINVLLSSDGSRIALLREDGDEVWATILDRKRGEINSENHDAFRVYDYGFSSQGDSFFYIYQNDDYEAELALLTENSFLDVDTGLMIQARFSSDGKNLIYNLQDDDGEYSIHALGLSDGTVEDVLEGEYLSFTIPLLSARMVIHEQDDDDLYFYSANLDGSGLLELFSENDVALIDQFTIPGENSLYLKYVDDEGYQYLFVTPIDEASGTVVIDELAQIYLLNRSLDGKYLVFAGVEDYGDDPILYSVSTDGERPVELDDDADLFFNAVFTSNGSEIIYTIATGDDVDDIEVRSVRSDGEERYETLYRESILIDVQWDLITPFDIGF